MNGVMDGYLDDFARLDIHYKAEELGGVIWCSSGAQHGPSDATAISWPIFFFFCGGPQSPVISDPGPLKPDCRSGRLYLNDGMARQLSSGAGHFLL